MNSPPGPAQPAQRPRTRLLVVGLGMVLAVAVVAALAGGGGSSSSDDTAGSSEVESEPGPDATTSSEAPPDTITANSGVPSSSTSATTVITTTSTTTTSTLPTPELDDLGARDLALGLVVTGVRGTDGPTRLREVVGSACVGGVFVSETYGNWTPVTDPAAARDAIAAIDRAARADGCPSAPLVATDAELGPIVRVPVVSPPAAPTWAERYASNPYDTATALYDEVLTYATSLHELGVDVNFGVVADVDTDPGNFMAESERTFGDDETITAALTATMVDAHCVAGVAPALKHFPNQGATVDDPHRGPSIAAGGLAGWRETGRLPYVHTAAPLVMTGHIVAEEDPQRPASMSRLVTTVVLREELGYEGVVVTDDLSTMRAAVDVIDDPGGRAVAAVDAGADLVLFVLDVDVAAAVDALASRIAVDPAFADRAAEAYTRVWRLKAALGLVPDEDPTDHPLCG